MSDLAMADDRRDHWPLHARQWALIGPPLRPAAEDVAIAERAVAEWAAASRRAPRALLLGVTPELATMRWPAGTRLLAVDRSAAMIDAIFPAGAGEAIAAEWLALPRDAASIDVALGDGCLSCLAHPAGYQALAAELGRVLVADGVAVLRLFAAPERREPLAEVAAALRAGRIASFHALKWRIAMAIQPDDRNVRVADILAAFDELAPDRAALPWPPEVIATIDVYRGSALVYSFPTAAEAAAALPGFVIAAAHTPGYELGERCPTLVLRRETR
jgi:SAM-dependent methyltransferase